VSSDDLGRDDPEVVASAAPAPRTTRPSCRPEGDVESEFTKERPAAGFVAGRTMSGLGQSAVQLTGEATMQKHTRTVDRNPFDAEILWGMDPQSIEAVTKACSAWFSQANRMRDEAVRFAQDRFAKELDAAVQLARCESNRSVHPAGRLPLKMAADYLAEGQKMVELMGAMAKEASSIPPAGKAHN
jgi:hypothetical protein